MRPPIPEDSHTYTGEFANCTFISKDHKVLSLRRHAYDDREFPFDKILQPNSSQVDMYATVAQPVVQDVLKGYNGTILA